MIRFTCYYCAFQVQLAVRRGYIMPCYSYWHRVLVLAFTKTSARQAGHVRAPEIALSVTSVVAASKICSAHYILNAKH